MACAYTWDAAKTRTKSRGVHLPLATMRANSRFQHAIPFTSRTTRELQASGMKRHPLLEAPVY
jgi:hypothetical protein